MDGIERRRRDNNTVTNETVTPVYFDRTRAREQGGSGRGRRTCDATREVARTDGNTHYYTHTYYGRGHQLGPVGASALSHSLGVGTSFAAVA